MPVDLVVVVVVVMVVFWWLLSVVCPSVGRSVRPSVGHTRVEVLRTKWQEHVNSETGMLTDRHNASVI